MKYFVLFFVFTLFSCNSGSNSELEQRLTQLEKENNKLKEQIEDKIQKPNEPTTQSIQNTNLIPQNKSELFEPTNKSNLNIGGNTKFVYVIIKTKEPELEHSEGVYISDGVGGFGGTRTNDINYVKWENYAYKSEIQEIQNYNEDKKFRLLDEVESLTRQKLSIRDINFRSEVFMKVRDENERSKLENNSIKIIDRKACVFDTYKEASEHKNKNKGNF